MKGGFDTYCRASLFILPLFRRGQKAYNPAMENGQDAKHLLDMTAAELAAEIESLGGKKFRAKQILEWVWQRSVVDFSEMKNLPATLRGDLRGRLAILTSEIETRYDAEDGVVKLLLRLGDGEYIETVLIPAGRRVTACLSTQVGCAMGCEFCASGLEGLRRNLTAGEILEQIIQLRQATGQHITNVVLMGTGEPLANYDAAVAAIRAMIDPKRGGISARRITLSTVGLPKGIAKLADEDLPITLAISLHAPNDALRAKIMPTPSRYPLADILDAAEEFFHSRGREITLEYTLLAGLNDSLDCAAQLAGLAGKLRCNVNLIRYNPVEQLSYAPPPAGTMQRFAETLRSAGVNVNIRQSRGSTVKAACGQLRIGK